MSLRIWSKWSTRAFWRRHMYSANRKPKPSVELVAWVLGRLLLICHHWHSIFWVWAPVVGSTKFKEWFTVRWVKFSWLRQSYAFQQSDMIVDPAATYSLIKGIRVAESRFGTSIRKISFVSRQMPPNTHLPSTKRPRLYFRRPNFDSSISTNPLAAPFLDGTKTNLAAKSEPVHDSFTTGLFTFVDWCFSNCRRGCRSCRPVVGELEDFFQWHLAVAKPAAMTDAAIARPLPAPPMCAPPREPVGMVRLHGPCQRVAAVPAIGGVGN